MRRLCLRSLAGRAPAQFYGAQPPRSPLRLHPQVGVLAGGSTRLGAVVEVGDAKKLDETDALGILDAVRAHGVVILKGQQLSRAEQVALTGKLGEVIVLPKSFEGNDPEPTEPAIQRITNFWSDGTWKGPDFFAGAYWHQDGQFWERPLHNVLSLLYGQTVSACGRGETGFVDLRAARASLPAPLLEQASGASIRASVHKIGDFAKGDPADLAAFPDVTHPMLAHHLLDGGPVLYLGSKHMEVCGLESNEAGRALLGELLEHATSPAFTYYHTWEPGDLLIWDNTQVLHHGMPYDNNGKNVREYYRTQARMREAAGGRITAMPSASAASEIASARAGPHGACGASSKAAVHRSAGAARYLYVGGCPASTSGGWARPPGAWQPPAEERAGIAAYAISGRSGSSGGHNGCEDLRLPSLALASFHATPDHISWIARSPTSELLYVTGGGANDGWLQAFRPRADGSLTPVGAAMATLGKAAHLELSADGRFCLTASYGAGTLAVLPVMNDGSVGAVTDFRKHTMTQADAALVDRQEACHVHQVRLDPTNQWALACDLGADAVYVYGFDTARGRLDGAPDSARHLRLPAGSGPRHLDWHPSAPLAYVLCELDGRLLTCAWDVGTGGLTPRHAISTLPTGVPPSRTHHCGGAHVLVSPCGTRVYVSTRAPNALVVFEVGREADGAPAASLSELQRIDSRGVCPRHFELDFEEPSSPLLRVGNQDTQTVASFPIRADGTLGVPEVTTVDGICPGILAR